MRARKTADERRLEIIEATLHLAGSLGPDRITADAIAQELGLTQPAIFRHFPRKDDIWAATIDWLTSALAELWARSTADSAPSECLPDLIDGHLGFVEAHPSVPLVLLSPELQARHPAIRVAIGRLMGLFHAELTRAVGEGAKAGAYRSDVQPAQAAWMLIAIIQGLALRWSIAGGCFDLRAEGRALIRLAIDGLKF